MVLTFLLGFIALRAVTNFPIESCWAFSGVAGCALLSAISFGAFLTQRFEPFYYVSALVGIVFLCIVVIKLRRAPVTWSPLPAWVLYIFLFWMALVAFQCITPVYTGAFMYGDWWMHYDISLFYRGLRPLDVQYFGIYGVPSRSPLFNLFCSFFLSILGDQFYVYQLAALIPGIALVCVALAFVRPTPLSLFLFLFNPFMITMILYPWPKVLTTAYILSGVYFFYRAQTVSSTKPAQSDCAASGFWQGLAVLTHMSAVFYILGIFAGHFVRRRPRLKEPLLLALWVGVPMLCVVLPWLGWVVHHYGFQSLLHASPAFIGDNGVLSLQGWINRVANLVASLLPLPIFIELFFPGKQFSWADLWLRFYYAVLPAACTLTVWFTLWKLFRRKSMPFDLPWPAWPLVAVTGFLCGIIFQPGLNLTGLTGESMAPVVAILLIVTSQIASRYPFRQQQTLMLLIAVEFFASRGVHTFLSVFGTVAENDPNLALKIQHGLIFAQDVIHPVAPFFLGFGLVVYFLLFYGLMRGALFDRQPSTCDDFS